MPNRPLTLTALLLISTLAMANETLPLQIQWVMVKDPGLFGGIQKPEDLVVELGSTATTTIEDGWFTHKMTTYHLDAKIGFVVRLGTAFEVKFTQRRYLQAAVAAIHALSKDKNVTLFFKEKTAKQSSHVDSISNTHTYSIKAHDVSIQTPSGELVSLDRLARMNAKDLPTLLSPPPVLESTSDLAAHLLGCDLTFQTDDQDQLTTPL